MQKFELKKSWMIIEELIPSSFPFDRNGDNGFVPYLFSTKNEAKKFLDKHLRKVKTFCRIIRVSVKEN